MKLYTVVIYHLKISMKSENTGPKDIKENNYCKEQKVSFVILLTVVVHIYLSKLSCIYRILLSNF